MESTSNLPMRATPHDGPDLLTLEYRCYRPVDVFSLRRLRYLLRSPRSLVLILRDETGTLMGYVIGLMRGFRMPSGRIYKITVNPDFQGRGLGSRLLLAMEQEFRRLGMSRCCAEVRVSNQASQQLFTRHGYRFEKRLPRYYDDGEDALKFWKTL